MIANRMEKGNVIVETGVNWICDQITTKRVSCTRVIYIYMYKSKQILKRKSNLNFQCNILSVFTRTG